MIGALARETRAIPIVFVTVSDPISSGFAADLAHPGGNITVRARGAPVPPGRPATPILHAFNSSRGIVL